MVVVEWLVELDFTSSVRNDGSVLRVPVLGCSCCEENLITLLPVKAWLDNDFVLTSIDGLEKARHSISWLSIEGSESCNTEDLVATIDGSTECHSLGFLITEQGDSGLVLEGFLLSSDEELTSSDKDVLSHQMDIEVFLLVDEAETPIDSESLQLRCLVNIEEHIPS